MKNILILNQRGGCGKSTTVQSMANILAMQGNKVLVIDLDPQRNTTDAFKAQSEDVATAYDLLAKEATAPEAIQHRDQIDIIAGDKYLSVLDRELKDPLILRNALKDIDGYDYLIMDTGPSMNMLTSNAIGAADSIIVPIQADRYSIMGLSDLFENVQAAKKSISPDLKIDGILITRFTDRAKLNRQIRDELDQMAANAGIKLFDSVIHEGIKIKEAQALRENLFTYAPKSRPALDYLEFVKEWSNGKE